MRSIWLTLLVYCLLAQMPAQAAESAARKPAGSGRDFVAIGVGLMPDYLGSGDYQLEPFGIASYRVGDMRYNWRGLSVSADFLELRSAGRWVGGVAAAYRPGRNHVESAVIDQLPKIDDTVDVGGFIGRRFTGVWNRSDALSAALGVMSDIGGVYNGYTTKLDLDYSSALSHRLHAMINLGSAYGSTGFMAKHFAVGANGAAASGLPSFRATDGLYQMSVSTGLNFQMNHRWGVFGQVEYLRLTGDARDSPIVRIAGDADQWRLGLAVSYRLD